MKKLAILLFGVIPVLVLLSISAMNPPKVEAVPSYARQTDLACSGCHYTPPELNPAGRRFKLTGYVDRGDDTKVIKAERGKKSSALDILASLPLSVMMDVSFTSTKSPVPTTQNGSFEFPQDISLFLAGAWTSHVGSFMQTTYSAQKDHFTSDNTDIRYANIGKLGRWEFRSSGRAQVPMALPSFRSSTTWSPKPGTPSSSTTRRQLGCLWLPDCSL